VLGSLQVFDRTPEDQVVARAQDAEILLTDKTPLAAEAVKQLPKLRYVGMLATGYDVVDLNAARERKIPVTNVPVYGTASVGQFTFALLLEVCHYIALHSDAARPEWSRSPDFCFRKAPLIELADKTIGIIGFGQIGRRVAEIAAALEMRVIVFDAVRSVTPSWAGFRCCETDELLAQSDVVSLHCPLLPSTHELINASSIAKMKQGAFLLHVARGPLFVEQDLADALNSGRLAGAAVDVPSSEPPAPDNPVWHARNCIVTPHIAWATKRSPRSIAQYRDRERAGLPRRASRSIWSIDVRSQQRLFQITCFERSFWSERSAWRFS
jgi:glycerate dehydrogenase